MLALGHWHFVTSVRWTSVRESSRLNLLVAVAPQLLWQGGQGGETFIIIIFSFTVTSTEGLTATCAEAFGLS